MANRCDICNKGTTTGNNVSHSVRKTRREWKANIQKVRAVQGNSVKKIKVCTSCLRSGKVTRAI